jgi:hypothetical protein
MMPDEPTTVEGERAIVEEAAQFLSGLLGVNPEQLRADVRAEVFRFTTTRDAMTRLRERGSSATKKALANLRNALQRLKKALNGVPEDFRLLFRANDIIRQLKSYDEFLDKKVIAIEETADGSPRLKFEPRHEKRNADDKRLAAESALRLFDHYALQATTTPNGPFETLSAILYGDKTAGQGINHHCRKLLGDARKGQVTNQRENDRKITLIGASDGT